MDHRPPPRFSLAERDRRWAKVRELMAMAGMDVMVAVDEPNCRSLTGVGPEVESAVFTADGEVTALSDFAIDSDETWVSDVRPTSGREVDALIERLSELGADRRIVGVTGLDPTARRPRGNLNYLTFIALREWFPHARWVGASQLMDEARWQKSAEEIAALEVAAECAEAALQTAAERAGTSGSIRDLWAEMLRAVIAAGGDPTSQVAISLDPAVRSAALPRSLDLELTRGLLVEAEAVARAEGYGVRAVQPLLLASPHAEPQPAADRLAELWGRVWEQLQPGRTVDEIIASAPAPGELVCTVRLDGMGLGDDLPYGVSNETVSRDLRGRALAHGVCFALELTVWSGVANRPVRVRWADTVIITHDGARRLGSRPLRLVVLS